MGMENLLNYYFIMKKRFVTVLLACSLAGGLFAQQPWFKDKDLTLTGAYYYPEHWDESQWERDFKQMHDLGFEFTHFAEFAWAQLEPEEGKYDFSWLDKAVALGNLFKIRFVCVPIHITSLPPVPAFCGLQTLFSSSLLSYLYGFVPCRTGCAPILSILQSPYGHWVA